MLSKLSDRFLVGSNNPKVYGPKVNALQHILNRNPQIKWEDTFYSVSYTAYEKLSSCVAKQKGMKFFESVRSFDPQYVRVHGWQDKWEDISPHLPQFDIDLELHQEFLFYQNWCAKNDQKVNGDDLIGFWKYNSSVWPNLAKAAIRSLRIPVSNAASERSFSQYNHVISDRRTLLTNDCARLLALLYVNGDVTGRLAGYKVQ